MLTGDLDRALGTTISSAGTWRPGPAAALGAYATSIAFLLASAPGGQAGGPGSRERGPAGAGGAQGAGPAGIAAGLAARLAGLDWVASAAVTGGGYLTVTVTPAALAALAVRITEAGPACARSAALHGTAVSAPRTTGLAAARTWPQARDRLARHLTGRLAEAAGAAVTWIDDPERGGPGSPPPPGGPSAVADAIAFAGVDAVTFALCRLPPGDPMVPGPRAVAAHHLGNPAYAVRYAHAHAASVLRQAADLGLDRGEAAGFQPRQLAHPREQALLGTLSWLPERVAGAARRGQPHVLARYLEELASICLSCQEECPAVAPGRAGRPGGEVTAARLWLVAAARTALAAGLGLLGVNAPDRL